MFLKLVLLFAFTSVAVAAESDDWGRDFDELIAEPGTKVIFGVMNGGDQTREIRLANGVSFTQVRHDGKRAGVIGNDNSGHGAVACAYGILLGMKGALSMCGSNENEIAEFETQLSRIESFMVANALPLRSVAGGDAARSQIAALRAKLNSDLLSADADKLATFCKANGAAILLKQNRAQWGGGKLKTYIDDLLSVPRPAVMNPCL